MIWLRSDYNVSCTCFHSVRFNANKKWMSIFCRSRIAVVLHLNRTHVISITSIKCVVVLSYRSRIVVESQLWYRLKAHFSLPNVCPVLETNDKPRTSDSKIRGYSRVYPHVKFWCFSKAVYSRNNYSWDNFFHRLTCPDTVHSDFGIL